MIRQATIADLDDVMTIIQATVAIMNQEGNDQWSEEYPIRADFEQDIVKEELYVYCDKEGVPRGLVCLNEEQLEAYEPLAWQLETPALVIHRMAVDPTARRQGIATQLMNFAEDMAAQCGLQQVRTDTYHCNERMQALFEKMGYCKVGQCYFIEELGAFYCYEKLL